MLDAETGKVVTSLDAAGDIMDALDVETHETAAEGVAGTVGVDDVLLLDLGDGEDRDVVASSNDGLVGALGDNDSAWTVVALGKLGKLLCDFLDVFGAPAGRLAVGTGFILVTKKQISVLDNAIQTFLEELGQERSAQVEGKSLVVFGSVLGHLEGRVVTAIVGEEEAAKVIVLCVLDNSPVLRLTEPLELELLGSGQVGNQRS